jgi:surface polysaccharide O-acyltransferase-like enzyme
MERLKGAAFAGERAGTARKRMNWMDVVRGSAIVLILWVHCGSLLRKLPLVLPDWWVWIADFFAPVRMPVLIFLSGMLLPNSLLKGATPYLNGKLRKLAWPLVIWTLLVHATLGTSAPLFGALHWMGISHLWFLFFILVYYIVGLATRRAPFVATAIAAWVCSFAAQDGSKYGERLLLLMCIFFLGAYAGKHMTNWLRMVDSRWALLSLPAALAAMTASALVGPFRYQPELLPIFLLCSFAAMVLIKRLTTYLPMHALQYLGRNSLIFYLSHVPTIFVVSKLLYWNGVRSADLCMAVSITVAAIVGIMLTWCSQRSAAVNWLFEMPAIDWKKFRRARAASGVERIG